MNDGGTAFPSHGSMGEVNFPGMSLRDAFALAALTGIIAGDGRLLPNIDREYELIAKDAWELADAMLEARKGQS